MRAVNETPEKIKSEILSYLFFKKECEKRYERKYGVLKKDMRESRRIVLRKKGMRENAKEIIGGESRK